MAFHAFSIAQVIFGGGGCLYSNDRTRSRLRVLRFGAWTSNADAAVNGYVTIKDAGGTVRKLATIA